MTDSLRARLEQLRLAPSSATVAGERLLQAEAVMRFFEARAFEPAWSVPAGAAEIQRAIRDVEDDGLTPADYHEATIGELIGTGAAATPQRAVDIQLLLADAVAGIIDHVRYGRVRPLALDPRWNVDPRFAAPPLDALIAQVADAPAPAASIASFKPTHFIYQGLKDALARLRAIQAAGGWPAVPTGATIRAGGLDERVPAIRRRLAISGELTAAQADAGTTYDPALEAAVKRFQERHRLSADGTIGRGTIEALNVSPSQRIAQLRVNMERARWILGGLRDSFVLVNLPAFKAYVIRDRQNVWETRTQIGKEARQTPTFRADMRYIVFNPDWTVPPTILAQDVLAGMRRGENTIKRKGLTIIDRQGRVVDPKTIDWSKATPRNFPYALQQPPGADNALGRVKFMFPNDHAIFLHDTPSRQLFAADQRTFSSGCIRVERPLELAAVLLQDQPEWTRERIQEVVDGGKSTTVFLREPLPVVIVYWTASVGASGELRFARDVYDLDGAVLKALDGGSRTRP